MPYLIGVRSDLMVKVRSAVNELGDPLDPPVYVFLDENRIESAFSDLEQMPEFLVCPVSTPLPAAAFASASHSRTLSTVHRSTQLYSSLPLGLFQSSLFRYTLCSYCTSTHISIGVRTYL